MGNKLTNTIIHKGGCACGKVRYEVKGNPEVTAVCHCRYCQLRSGSAFGTLVYFSKENFKLVFGRCSSFKFVSESGNSWKNQFCKHCATTLTSRLEVRPNEVGVAGGTFDPPTFWYNITAEVFTRTKAHFVGKIPSERKSKTIHYYSPKIIEEIGKKVIEEH